MDAIEAVLWEFVYDVEAAYGVDCFNDDEFEADWSDLAVTYRNAKRVLPKEHHDADNYS